MRFLILALCLVASVCTFHLRTPKVVVKNVEIINRPDAKYKLDKIIPIADLVKHEQVDNEPKGIVPADAVLNDFGDRIFTNVQNAIIQNGLEPMALPDLTETFEYTVIVTFTGELILTNGWLSDVSTIHRGGDLVIAYDNTAKHLTMTLPIAFNDLMFVYDYSASIMDLGPSGYIDGKVMDVQIEAKIGFSTTDIHVTLDSFEVVHAGSIDLAFHGSDLIDWLLDLLSDIATTLLHDTIINLVEGFVRDSVQSIVDALNQGIDDTLNPTTPAPEMTSPIPFYRK